MIVNAEALASIYVAISTLFNKTLENTVTWWPQVAMQIPTKAKIVDLKFILDFPGVREWIGDRVVQSLAGKNYQVAIKEWEATLGIKRWDVEADQVGLYNPVVSGFAQAAKKHPDKLVAALLKNGFTDTCYDARPFFDATHPVGDGTQSNYGGGAGTAWYLLDTSKALKPFCYLLDKPAQLVAMDRETDDNVFTRGEFVYGIDGRWAAAYGLWQYAYASKDTLNATNYAAARQAMTELKDAKGDSLDIKGTLLVVPPSLEAAAKEILLAERNAAGATNIWRDTANLLVVGELA